jgi:hypothetical protein
MQDFVLASAAVAPGDRLYLTAHRTGDWIKAYEVTVLRVTSSSNVSVCFIGSKEAYWWGASLEAAATSDDVSVRAFGAKVGTYSLSTGSYTRNDRHRTVLEGCAAQPAGPVLLTPFQQRLIAGEISGS